MPAHERGQDVSFKCLDVCNSLAILPTCAIPLCICFLQESQRGQKQWLVWHESSLWCETGPPHSLAHRAWWQRHHSGVQEFIPAPLRHVQQAPTTEARGEKAQLTGQGFCASLSRKGPFRWGVPSRGWLPPAQHTGILGEGCLPNTPQTPSGAQVRQAAAGTWGWCLGHTTSLQPGPKVALEASEAQKQTPSWHLLCKAKGYQHTGSKIQKQAKYFSQLRVCQRQTLNCLGVPELAWVKALKWFPYLW